MFKHVSTPLPQNSFWGYGSALTLLLAALFRITRLHEIPVGLSQDEVLNADIVESIRAGNHALFFRQGFGHEPLYHYLAVPFQALLGDNVLSIRLPAVFLGLIGLALLLRWARRQFGPTPALIAAALMALSWWPIIFSRVGLRPILGPVLLSAMALNARRRPILAGLFLGLAFYSYTPLWIMAALPPLMLAYHALQRQKSEAKAWAIISAVSTAIALPLALTLRADPSLLERGSQLSGPLSALRLGDWQPLWTNIKATLGVFSFSGDPRWTYTLPGRPIFAWYTSFFFYFGLWVAARQWRDARYALVIFWLMVGILPSMLTPDAPSTIRLIGAMPVIYLLPAIGAVHLWRIWPAPPTRPLITLLLGLILAQTAIRTIDDGFITWPQTVEGREKYQAVSAEITSHITQNHSSAPVVNSGFYYPIDDDSLNRNAGHTLHTRWTQGGNALIWPLGSRDGALYVPEAAPLNPQMGVFVEVSAEPIYRSPAKPAFAAYPMPPIPHFSLSTPIIFSDQLTLLGYQSQFTPNNSRTRLIATLWRVEQPLQPDLKLFIHLIGSDPQPLSQHDGLDAIPQHLQVGDIFIQLHHLEMPEPPIPDLQYHLGIYHSQTGQRLITNDDSQNTTILNLATTP